VYKFIGDRVALSGRTWEDGGDLAEPGVPAGEEE